MEAGQGGFKRQPPCPAPPSPAAELPQKGEPQRHRPSDPPSSGSFLDWKMLGKQRTVAAFGQMHESVHRIAAYFHGLDLGDLLPPGVVSRKGVDVVPPRPSYFRDLGLSDATRSA